jgi:uncharacterized protein YukE
MATYSANPASMAELEDILRAETNRIRQSITALAEQAAYFAAHTSGEAIFSYRSAQDQWDRGMQQMELALQAGGANLGSIRDNIVRTDNSGAALF